MAEITNTQDLIDIRDIITRYEELKSDLDTSDLEDEALDKFNDDNSEEFEEMESLEKLIEECRGNGGDHKYDGSWFPVTLIHDDYFDGDFAENECQECGYIL